jgi:hypothetical protein
MGVDQKQVWSIQFQSRLLGFHKIQYYLDNVRDICLQKKLWYMEFAKWYKKIYCDIFWPEMLNSEYNPNIFIFYTET